MVGINNEKIDEIGEKLGIQRRDLPRRKHYFLKIIFRYFLEFIIIVLSASMGLYIADQLMETKYPYRSPGVLPAAISGIPVIFLLMGLNSRNNPEDSIQRSELKLKLFKGFSVIYIIAMVFILYDTIFTPKFPIASEYGVFKNERKNFFYFKKLLTV